MASRILITGGAGFIGSHLADELLQCGYEVRVLDCLNEQVHGKKARRPDYLASEVELLTGDVRNSHFLDRALHGVDSVVHLAASVGVGQSMYQIASYTDVNCTGTAELLESMARRPVKRLVVASSMSIYGEGLYRAQDGRIFDRIERPVSQLRQRVWDVFGPEGEVLQPIPTPETKFPLLPSVYALSKYYQERCCLAVAAAYGTSVAALRFFNVVGTRQALSNPYTGVLAIFASRILNGRPPLVNEDGNQIRDFVYVKDVARACRLALEKEEVTQSVFNIGSGQRYKIKDVAVQIAEALGRSDIAPEITGKYRIGDIRNCFADITLARAVLKFKPSYSLQDALSEMAPWLEEQTAEDRVAVAAAELDRRGLTV